MESLILSMRTIIYFQIPLLFGLLFGIFFSAQKLRHLEVAESNIVLDPEWAYNHTENNAKKYKKYDLTSLPTEFNISMRTEFTTKIDLVKTKPVRTKKMWSVDSEPLFMDNYSSGYFEKTFNTKGTHPVHLELALENEITHEVKLYKRTIYVEVE